MVIDTSAVVAILLGESEAALFARQIAADPTRLMSAMSALEAAIVMQERKGPAGIGELDLQVQTAGFDIVSLDADQVRLARSAYDEFGQGRHPAKLNLGDCCSYALARATGEPLLFKGNDFSRTDLKAVVEESERL